jgi:hypothetical protein
MRDITTMDSQSAFSVHAMNVMRICLVHLGYLTLVLWTEHASILKLRMEVRLTITKQQGLPIGMGIP